MFRFHALLFLGFRVEGSGCRVEVSKGWLRFNCFRACGVLDPKP